MNRPDKEQYYSIIAMDVASRSTCLRRQYGAVLVKNDEIIATGYNGSPRGEVNCTTRGCCWREKNRIPQGERYEECVAVHAEQNAMISASRAEMIDSELYLYGFDVKQGESIEAAPCKICMRMLKNAGIRRYYSGCEWHEL